MSLNSIKNYTLPSRQSELCDIYDFTKGDIKKHIIKWSKENDDKYYWRTKVSYYQDYVSPIIGGLTSMIFNKDHILNVDEMYLNNIDMAGTNLYKFMQGVTSKAIRDGLTFIIADSNIDDSSNVSLNDMNNGLVRGYLKNYSYLQLVNFKMSETGIIKQVVFKDSIQVDVDGDLFKTENIDRYIVYKIGGGDIYHSINNKIELIRSWSNSLDKIPMSVVYGNFESKGLDVDSIILKIQKLNKSHLNLKSGLMNVCHIASNPTPVIWGTPSNVSGGSMEIGVNSVISFATNQGNAYDFQWREITGNSVDVAEREIKSLEDYIISSSFNILRSDSFATATEAKLVFGKNKSILNSIAESLEHGFNSIFKILETLLGVKILKDAIAINRDFDNFMLTGDQINNIIKLKDSGNISIETLWETLIDGDIIKISDFDIEKERIKDEISLGL